MFCPLDDKETVILIRGFLFLCIIILFGVFIAEGQLHTLTQREESASIFNISCDSDGRYSVGLLGYSYGMNAVYSVGQFINNDEEIIIRVPYHSMTIPKYIEFDCRKERALLQAWIKLLVEECSQYKHSIAVYITSLQQRFNVYMGQYR